MLDVSLVKWKTGEAPELLVATSSVSFTVPEFEHITASGYRFQVETKPELEVETTPDYAQIGEWILKELGAEALIAIGEAAAPAAAAFIVFLGVYYAAEEGMDIGEISARAATDLQLYAEAYSSVITGGAPVGAGAAAQKGAAEARAKLVDLKGKYPEAVVADKAREAGLYGKIVAQAKPGFRDWAIAEYKRRHPWKSAIFGVPSDFLDHVDTRLGHVGDKRDEARVGQRDDQGRATGTPTPAPAPAPAAGVSPPQPPPPVPAVPAGR